VSTFTPADGSIFAAGEQREIQKPTQVLLGQPAVYPTRLVGAIKTLFRDRESVKAAYLAQVFMPESDATPHPSSESIRPTTIETSLTPGSWPKRSATSRR
jgi:hypothetical protein